MLKYVAKFASDILPSVAATIIGAYIVNHYITAKPVDAPPAPAALSSTAAPPAAPDSKPAETSTDVASIPAAGVRAKGIPEKAVQDKAAADKPQDKAQEKTAEKDKPEDKPADTASISADTRRRPASSREKTAIRTIPLTAAAAQPATSAPATTNPAPTVEAAVNPDEHRDANDLARLAIERLRENSPRQQDATRAPDASRVPGGSQAAAPTSVQPLPPPVMVAAPAGDTFAPGSNGQMQQSYPSSAQAYDPNRPIPPADIPSAQPLELRTDNNGVPPLQQHNKNVAEDMLSAAKSVFHAVLPQ
jgi:hypothetical protein